MYRPYLPRPHVNGSQQHRSVFRGPDEQNHHRYPFSPNRFNGCYEPSEPSREYWCETCDRDFKTFQLLENHMQQHQKCNIDGCQFIAHPKVITKHIQMQHSSGLYKKIAKLANPEEIQKWREERKKKYPTKENIDKKNAQIKEKIDRGEKMGLKKSYFQERKPNPDLKRRHNNKIRNDGPKNEPYNKKSRRTPRQPKVPKELPEPENRFKLKPFAGIQDLVDSEPEQKVEVETSLDIDDEEILEIGKVAAQVEDQPALCGALNSLVNDYGSSDGEPEGENPAQCSQIKEETKIVINSQPISTQVSNTQAKEDSDSGPEEVCIVKDNSRDLLDESQSGIKKVSKKLPIKMKPNFRNNYKPKVPSTLLHKLLQREVQQERNMILQCIRYIVSKKYFDT